MACSSVKAIGLFGGTFDPVHKAHIAMAQEARQLLDLDVVRMLPCHQPPHRDTPSLTSDQRLHLLELAVAGEVGLEVDDRELRRDKPSWTVDTLEELRKELGEQISLVLIMGSDAFEHFATWHRWQDIPALAHIAVLQRPDYPIANKVLIENWIKPSQLKLIHEKSAGKLVALENVCQPWSATAIRQKLERGIMPEELSLPVQHYIAKHQLYGYPGDAC